ncbi:hypothetical protein ABW19_dt0205226 [Dactylella cylindrospora]|nr:hypothetical protein ABW19_dt0205226 [Dactylella cylindrospora]
MVRNQGNSSGIERDDSSVLVLQLGDATEAEIVKHRHSEFLATLKDRFGATIVTDQKLASQHITNYRPYFILAIDSGFADPKCRKLQDQVAEIVRSGACFVMCCEFPRNVSKTNWKQMILNRFSLTWELGKFRDGVYTLHTVGDILTGIHHAPGIETELRMKVVHIYDVDMGDRLYTHRDLDARAEKEIGSCAVAFCHHEYVPSDSHDVKGYVCYIGDVDTGKPMQEVLFFFMKKYITQANTAAKLHQMKLAPSTPPTPVYTPKPRLPPLNWVPEINRLNNTPRRLPCNNCGKKETNRRCFKCEKVFWCSSACQNAGERGHRRFCPAQGITLAECIKQAVEGNPKPLIERLIMSQKDHFSVLERLIDTYRLRVEDMYTISNIEWGRYRKRSLLMASHNDTTMSDFVVFLVKLHSASQPARPEWWDNTWQIKCEDMAKNRHLRTFIGNGVTDAEIVERYGSEDLMPMALRVLGDVIYGEKVPERVDEEEELARVPEDVIRDGRVLEQAAGETPSGIENEDQQGIEGSPSLTNGGGRTDDLSTRLLLSEDDLEEDPEIAALEAETREMNINLRRARIEAMRQDRSQTGTDWSGETKT